MDNRFYNMISEEELKNRMSPVWPYKYFKPGQPVDPAKVDDLLKGVIDIHLHGAPLGGWLAGRPSIVSTCIEASKAGMRALVFKDHNTMSNNVAIVINEMLAKLKTELAKQGEDFKPVDVFGGVVLNSTVGGINPRAVETALDYGKCAEVWLPSLDAKFQKDLMGQPDGICVMEGNEPVKELIQILELISEYNSSGNSPRCSLSTCHVSNEEKFGVLKYVRKRGLNVDVVMDHVTQELTNVTPQEAKEMIDLGAYLEFAETSCVPWPGMQDWVIAFDYSFNLIKELIREKGPDHLVLITDAGQPGNEPVPGWKTFLKTLLAQGVSEEDINTMAKEVPAKLLGI
jgi:hypothetical protein